MLCAVAWIGCATAFQVCPCASADDRGGAGCAGGWGRRPHLGFSTDAEYTICGYSGASCSVTLSVNSGLLIVGIGGQSGASSGDVSAVSVCSTSLTQGATNGLIIAGSNFAEIWYGVIACSGSQTLSMTWTGGTPNMYEVDAAAGTLTGYISSTPTSSCINSIGSAGTTLACSSAVTVPSSGIAIGVGYQRDNPISWAASSMTLGNSTGASSDGSELINGSNTSAGSPRQALRFNRSSQPASPPTRGTECGSDLLPFSFIAEHIAGI